MKTLSIDDVKVEDPKPTFCVAVGWPGVALYALASAVAGAHLYIAAEFTFYFQDMQREYIWLRVNNVRHPFAATAAGATYPPPCISDIFHPLLT